MNRNFGLYWHSLRGTKRRGSNTGVKRHLRRSGLGSLFIAYLCAIGVIIILAVTGGMCAGMLTYPIAGIVLSRKLHQVFRYQPFRANLLNVARTKIHFIATWPITMPMFLILGAVNRYL